MRNALFGPKPTFFQWKINIFDEKSILFQWAVLSWSLGGLGAVLGWSWADEGSMKDRWRDRRRDQWRVDEGSMKQIEKTNMKNNSWPSYMCHRCLASIYRLTGYSWWEASLDASSIFCIECWPPTCAKTIFSMFRAFFAKLHKMCCHAGRTREREREIYMAARLERVTSENGKVTATWAESLIYSRRTPWRRLFNEIAYMRTA